MLNCDAGNCQTPTLRYLSCMRPHFVLAAAALALVTMGQHRLPSMPGYARYNEMRAKISQSVVRGDMQVSWVEGGKAFTYRDGDKTIRYDVTTHARTEVKPPPSSNASAPQTRQNPSRGRQFTVEYSPDGKLQAVFKNSNVWIGPRAQEPTEQISTDGDAAKRIACGTASWVYGEELGVRSAMWWSPDSKKLAYYRFDNSNVKDYFLALNQSGLYTEPYIEPYVKAGDPNPVVDLFIYDLESKKTVQVDVRDGKPFSNDVVGHYIYDVRWSKDGKELFFNRTNRRQNVMEWTAADPASGKCRVIIREEWLPSWTDNHPRIHWLTDDTFLWVSERNGYSNFYQYNLKGELLATVTNHSFEVANIVSIIGNSLFYMARSGDNPYKLQLHRVGLDGKGDRRLTDPADHHSIQLAPDGKHFVDTFETHDIPPVTALRDADGRLIEKLKESDISKFEELSLKRVELFEFTAGDGKTKCYGVLHKPSQFDPNRKYPLLVGVYAGPESGGLREAFTTPNSITEFGFLFAEIHGRGTNGRGKEFTDAMYLKCGVTEIDDQAAGVKELAKRPYVDASKVGIYGTSYGGYASVMCILRHPDVFAAACASASVTDWRNYDSIYTERYMWIPQENKEGYDAGSAMTYAANLKGWLMLFHGTADDNVHLSNTIQLIRALQRAGKSFEVQLGPDMGHAGINFNRMMEFFIERLVMTPAGALANDY